MVNVVALRNTSFKNQRCGIYSIRLKEIASYAIANALKPDCSVTAMSSSRWQRSRSSSVDDGTIGVGPEGAYAA